MMNIRLSTSNFFEPSQLFISNLHVIAMRKVIRVNFSPIVCKMLRWDAAAAHFPFTKSVYSYIFPLLCLSTPQKLSNDMTDIVKHSVSSTHSISLQQPLCEWFLKMFTMNRVQYSLWGASVVGSVPVFAAARAIVSFSSKYIWISVSPVTDNEAKLYLDTFYFSPRHYRRITFYNAFYPLLAILKQSFKLKRQKV